MNSCRCRALVVEALQSARPLTEAAHGRNHQPRSITKPTLMRQNASSQLVLRQCGFGAPINDRVGHSRRGLDLGRRSSERLWLRGAAKNRNAMVCKNASICFGSDRHQHEIDINIEDMQCRTARPTLFPLPMPCTWMKMRVCEALPVRRCSSKRSTRECGVSPRGALF
jgi:hypothetical protein